MLLNSPIAVGHLQKDQLFLLLVTVWDVQAWQMH